MPRPVTVGLNGTPASLAAASWGAHEASIRHLPLRLVSAWEWQPYSRAPLSGTDMPEQWSRRLPEEAAAQLAHRFPDLDISTQQLTGPPPEMLCREAAEAELLAIGTAGLGALAGFLMGSVAMATVAHTHRPVVLVRPEGSARPDDESFAQRARDVEARDTGGPVIAGIDLGPTTDGVLRFAFEAAAVRSGELRIVYSWNPPVGYVQGIGGDLRWRADIAAEGASVVRSLLEPRSKDYPGVSVSVHGEIGSPARHLVEAAAQASLVVIGRRTNRYWPREPRVGHVAHAVLHHSPAPVAVVPQD
ncbi:universal stress protein [Streptomyces sp. NBC_01013]|uniref:universal stress protein n=1 Tax=Streptomyces sp. NBC_01013 TaxID=2903718 RepID=UPI00386EE662|nr:universal stress protein [Streptomyces sp. NBC_01013]